MKAYKLVTDAILQKLNQGVIPWHKTWVTGLPCSFVTGNAYRGVNVILLGLKEHTSKYWVTFHQAQKLKGYVRRKEKGSPVIFWHWRDEEEKRKLIAKGKAENPAPCFPFIHYVYNLDQTEGIEAPEGDLAVEKKDKLHEAEKLIAAFKNAPEIQSALQIEPKYMPTIDVIHMPHLSQFKSANHYYSVLFHELIHSTGHRSRLNREFESAESKSLSGYSFEELVAEIGSAFLCGACGIENLKTIEDQAAYIGHWQTFLKGDATAFMRACSEAQKAVDYIRGITFGEEKEAA